MKNASGAHEPEASSKGAKQGSLSFHRHVGRLAQAKCQGPTPGAGIEVILDVVFNHIEEGNENGPTFSFKGFVIEVYYYLVPGDRHTASIEAGASTA